MDLPSYKVKCTRTSIGWACTMGATKGKCTRIRRAGKIRPTQIKCTRTSMRGAREIGTTIVKYICCFNTHTRIKGTC